MEWLLARFRLLRLLGVVGVAYGLVVICASATPDGSASTRQASGVLLLLAGIAVSGVARAMAWRQAE